jgi:hypothetical protein
MRRRLLGDPIGILGPASDPTLLEVEPVDARGLPWDLASQARPVADVPGLVPGASFDAGSRGGATASLYAWPGVVPVQGDALLNFGFVSPAGQDLLIPLPSAVGTRIHLYSLVVRCSAGATQVTIQDGALFLFPPGLIPAIGANLTPFVWNPGLTFRENSPGTILLTTAGPGNIVYASVQADRF